jgi:hypothetical protein
VLKDNSFWADPGSDNAPNKTVSARAGATIYIAGTDLNFVTRVIDQQLHVYPFTFQGSQVSGSLAVTLPKTPGALVGLLLGNSLSPSTETTQLDGFVQITQ